MFTGIIDSIGIIKSKTPESLKLSARKELIRQLKRGGSVAVNGACLTVKLKAKNYFVADVMPETWDKTMLKSLNSGQRVNLELPMRPVDFIGGHIVQGHVDAVVKILKIDKKRNSKIFTFLVPKFLRPYLVKKASVAINGVSLTVIDVGKKICTVGIIPFTLRRTIFGNSKAGDFCNIEIDILAKYAFEFTHNKKIYADQ